MPNDLLDGIRAKIERASIHLSQFEHHASPFQRRAYTTRVEPDFKAGVFRLIAKDMGVGDPPIQLRLLAGEIAYQLRSALDHLAFIFAVQVSEWSREFPIFDTRDGYETKGRAKIKGMSAYHEAIVESVQPLKRGDGSPAHYDPLWMLHSINNTDKHRVIPACATYPSDLRVKVQTRRVAHPLRPLQRVGTSNPKDPGRFALPLLRALEQTTMSRISTGRL
jgi:hypothetical protein